MVIALTQHVRVSPVIAAPLACLFPCLSPVIPAKAGIHVSRNLVIFEYAEKLNLSRNVRVGA